MEQWKVSLKPQDVPRVNERSTINASFQQLFYFRQQVVRNFDVVAVDRSKS